MVFEFYVKKVVKFLYQVSRINLIRNFRMSLVEVSGYLFIIYVLFFDWKIF